MPLGGVILDLGAGTGALATGYAARGCVVCAVDISAEMLAHVKGPVIKLVSRAEDCTFADESFDAIVVGQAWHWFDEHVVAPRCQRALRPAGKLVIASFDYRPSPGSVAERTEGLILRYNPSWPLAGYKDWLAPRAAMLARHGFIDISSAEYDELIPYTKDSWRGRMQACNGVLATHEDARQRFDADLDEMLTPEPDPMEIPHRVSWVIGHRP